MGTIRPFRSEDIPQIVDLNTRLFPGSATLTRQDQERRFREVCLQNPWYDPKISSLVHEEQDGRISGFLGIVPRKMLFKGTPITLAVGQHMMVDRATLAGLQLFKAFISGPQDVTMADMSADVTRKLWERIGGTTIYLHSTFWRKPLRPLSYAVSYLKKSKSRSIIAAPLEPVAKGIDMLLNRQSIKQLHIARPSTSGEPLTVETILSCFPKFSAERLLVPGYTEQSLTWLFDLLQKERRFGRLRRILVRNKEKDILGWFVYYANADGKSEVLQIAGTRTTFSHVLAHLFYDAWEQGCRDLGGRVDPIFMKELSDTFCLFTPGSAWMLMHAKSPEIMNAVQGGNVFLSRFEGDLWFL